jgi:hypothetical protein
MAYKSRIYDRFGGIGYEKRSFTVPHVPAAGSGHQTTCSSKTHKKQSSEQLPTRLQGVHQQRAQGIKPPARHTKAVHVIYRIMLIWREKHVFCESNFYNRMCAPATTCSSKIYVSRTNTYEVHLQQLM